MSESSDANPPRISETLVCFEEGIGNDKKYHIAHVSPLGLTFIRKLKDYAKYQQLVREARDMPDNAVELLQSDSKAEVHPLETIARVTYAEQLNQLYLFDKQGKRTPIPDGTDKAQEKLFTAFKQFGGSQSEEEADAWSVLKTPLFALSVIAVIGGFFIHFTTICEPTYIATGRRAGMNQLLNTVGYTIGPVWASIVVALLAAAIVSFAICLLIKRPIRQILSFD